MSVSMLDQVSPVAPVVVPNQPRLCNQAEDLVVKIATHRDEVFDSLKLVYKSYLKTGLVAPNPHEIRVLSQHLLPTTEIFTAKRAGQVLCTMTLVRDGKEGLPMEDIYADEVAARRKHAKIAEVSSLADAFDGKDSTLSVLFQTMSLMAQSAKQRGVNELLITVHPHHAGFYHRFIGFETIGGLKTYQSVQNRPAVALMLDLDRLHINHPRAYKRFFGKPFPKAQIESRFLADSIRYELYCVLKSIQHSGAIRRRQAEPKRASLRAG